MNISAPFRPVGLLVLLSAIVLAAMAGRVAGEDRTAERAKEITSSIGMKLKLIQAGEFMMGAPDGEEGRDDDEGQVHRVHITKSFYLGVYEVTVGQFGRFVKDTGYRTDAQKGGKGGWGVNERGVTGQKPEYTWKNPGFAQTDDHPVVNVSWNDAVGFCRWLSKKEGKTYRLPTEAEWEYACRGGTTTRFFHGDDPEGLVRMGNVADGTAKAKFPDWKWAISGKDGYVFTAPVGRYRANSFGLYDMHGNVFEWCSDRYPWQRKPVDDELAESHGTSPVDDPQGPEVGSNRVGRGGSWNYGAAGCRSAYRSHDSPDARCHNLGFRVALSLAHE